MTLTNFFVIAACCEREIKTGRDTKQQEGLLESRYLALTNSLLRTTGHGLGKFFILLFHL